ncbi:MAG: hypothetical protein LUH07_09095 [Lachnospiraceae bacterium]|nr:hypothetical protein [Lachnospiraceae bacterium]
MEKQHREEVIKRRNEQARNQIEECRKRDEELDRERSAICQSGMIPETVFLTKSEIDKKEFCERKSGKTDITKDVISVAWEALFNADKEEKQRLVNLPGERKGQKRPIVISMDKEDKEKLKYCRYSSIMKESDAYSLGLELYKRRIMN